MYAQNLVLPIVCHKWGSVFVYLLVPVGTSIPELNRHLLTRHLGAAATDQYHRCYSESMQCWSFFATPRTISLIKSAMDTIRSRE